MKFEKGIKMSGSNTVGLGMIYTKIPNTTLKTEKVSLQYIDEQTNKPNGPYQPGVLWVNFTNARMESSNY